MLLSNVEVYLVKVMTDVDNNDNESVAGALSNFSQFVLVDHSD